MENNILITDNSHNKIFQTYAELKRKLPPNFLKIKVFSSPKYALNKKPILKKIENDTIISNYNYKHEKPSSIDKIINGSKNIYILSDKTIKLKNSKNNKKLYSNEQKYDEMMKKTLLTEKEKEKDKNNYNNYNDKDNINSLEFIEKYGDLGYYGYNFRSSPISDVQMKSNIYLPKIIDRMKYNIPRNERDKNGFHVEGIGIFSNNKVKYDEKNDNYEISFNTNDKENDNINDNNH